MGEFIYFLLNEKKKKKKKIGEDQGQPGFDQIIPEDLGDVQNTPNTNSQPVQFKG